MIVLSTSTYVRMHVHTKYEYDQRVGMWQQAALLKKGFTSDAEVAALLCVR